MGAGLGAALTARRAHWPALGIIDKKGQSTEVEWKMSFGCGRRSELLAEASRTLPPGSILAASGIKSINLPLLFRSTYQCSFES